MHPAASHPSTPAAGERPPAGPWQWIRAFGPVAGLAALPVVLLVAIVTALLREEMRQVQAEEITSIASGVLSTVDSHLENGKRVAVALATSPDLRRGDYDDFALHARRLIAADANIDAVVVTDVPRGIYLYHSDLPDTPGKSAPAGPNALRQGRQVISSGSVEHFGVRLHGPTIPVPTIPFRAPVSSPQSAGTVLTIMLKLQRLDGLFSATTLPAGWQGVILDDDGVVAAGGGPGAAPVGAKLGKVSNALVDFGAAQVRVAVRSPETGWAVVVQAPASHLDRRFRQALTYILLGGLAAIVWAAFLALRSAQRVRESQALREARDLAEASNRAKTEFLAHMSHELRTPLNAIIGYAQLLESERGAADPAEAAPEAQRSAVKNITQAGWHLLALIEEVLDLSRVEAGATQLERVTLALAPLLRECVAQVQQAAADAQVRLLAPRTEAGASHVVADPLRLKQIVLNLLSNAAKYNRPGGEIALTARALPAGRVALEVRDTGQGLTPQQVEALFQPFVRLAPDDDKVHGTGVGLALSRRLAELMGGSLTARSKPLAGSVFTLELERGDPESALPAPSDAGEAPGEAGASRTGGGHANPGAGTQGTIRVLYVEDNRTNWELVRLFLERAGGFALLRAASGAEGIALAKQQLPDVVLLDMNLPDLHGRDVQRLLAAEPLTAAIPVIALSADALSIDVAAARRQGFADYLTKPVRMSRLVETLRRVCGRADKPADGPPPAAPAAPPRAR